MRIRKLGTRLLVLVAANAIVSTACANGTAQATPSSSVESDCALPPAAALGTFDRPAFEDTFGVPFELERQGNGWRLYSVGEAVYTDFHFAFAVDPQRGDDAVVWATAHIDLPDTTLSETEQAALDRWLATIADVQPEAAEWLEAELDEYRAATTPDVGWAKTYFQQADGTCVKVGFGTFKFGQSLPAGEIVWWEVELVRVNPWYVEPSLFGD